MTNSMGDTNISKKRKYSKNKKKTWRKHIDISDIEKHLDDVSHQERTGGIVAEKSDKELFFIETAIPSEEKVKEKGKKLDLSSLRCHSNLWVDTKVKPFKFDVNVKKLKPEPDNTLPITKREVQSVEQRKQSIQSERKQLAYQKSSECTYDLWSVDAPKNVDEENEYLEVTKKKAVKLPKSYSAKPSKIDAVEVPHPGASYNPAFDEYVKLINLANDVEVKKDKADKRVKRALYDMFPYAAEHNKEETYIKEMTEGIMDEPEEKDEETIESDNEDLILTVNPSTHRENKKTIAQRNKEKKIARRLNLKKKQKLHNLHRNQFFRIKSLRRTVEQEHMKAKQIVSLKEKKRKENEGKTKRLGKLKFQDADIEVKLTDELTGNLRSMKPEGNLIEDRFFSLQKRNLIEPRKRANFKLRYKRKEFEKKGHQAIKL